MKKIAIIMSVFVFLLVFVSPRSAYAGDDITGNYFESDMRFLISQKIMNGYDDGTFRPEKDVTRAEFTAFLVRALKIPATSGAVSFSDVKQGDWFYADVLTANSKGLIGGYPDGSFQPKKNISRQEMAIMIERALAFKGYESGQAPLQFLDNAKINPIFYTAIQKLLYLEIVRGKVDSKGNLFYGPLDNTTRGETSAILTRTLDVLSKPREVVQQTNYNTDFSAAVNKQMESGWPKVDGKGQYSASESLVTYYANPANFSFGTSDYLQFLVLSQNTGLSAEEINNKILLGKGVLEGKAAAFIEAGKTYSINEIYLLAHALHETGNGTSNLAKGILVKEVDGKPVEPKVTYNMFGIGAVDAAPDRLGSERAYKEGWFTPEAAIIGGAKFIDNGYISQGQNTLYKMKWNPDAPATHQYATHVSWALTQTKQIENIYNMLETYVRNFDVPQYANQPAATAKPTGIDMYNVNTHKWNGIKVVTTDQLNVRSGPTTGFDRLVTLPKAADATIIGENGGWFKIEASGNTGWIHGGYVLNKLEDIQVQTISNLNLRTGPDASFTRIYTIPNGTTITVIGEVDGWYKVNAEGKTGFVSAAYTVNKLQDATATATADLKLRSSRSTSSDSNVLTTLSSGTAVAIIGQNGSWYKVEAQGKIGWVAAKSVTLASYSTASVSKKEAVEPQEAPVSTEEATLEEAAPAESKEENILVEEPVEEEAAQPETAPVAEQETAIEEPKTDSINFEAFSGMTITGEIAADNVHFRSEPSVSDSATIIRTLPIETKAEVLDHDGEWYFIKIGEEEGWVFDDFLSILNVWKLKDLHEAVTVHTAADPESEEIASLEEGSIIVAAVDEHGEPVRDGDWYNIIFEDASSAWIYPSIENLEGYPADASIE